MSCIVSSSYVLTEDTPEIVLVTRDKDYNRKKIYIKYIPYFFVRETEYEEFISLLPKRLTSKFLSTDQGFIGVDGHRLIKVAVTEPSVIGEINQLVKRDTIVLYESNIPFHYRYLIDKRFTTGIDPKSKLPVKVESRHKRVFIDIEVLADSKPSPRKDQIIVIGLYDYFEKKYHSIFIGNNFVLNTDVILSDVKDVVLHPCIDEFELIEEFASLWSKIQPDIVVSFGDFDMQYLVNRMYTLQIAPSFLSPIYNVSLKNRLHIHCLNIIDYEQLFRTVYGEPVWNTLEYVSNKTLGYGKIKLPDGIVKTFLSYYTKVVEYNLRDVELILDLDNELGLIDNFLLFIWSETGLDLEDCFMANRIGDICHIRHLDGKYIFKSESNCPKVDYLGAIVEADEPGLHFNVGVFDWNELYPSIMELFHISIDTLDENGDIVINKDMKFLSSRTGWTNDVMLPFRVRRQEVKASAKREPDEHKRNAYKILSQALKVISNAQYGLYGQKTKTFTSRFYDTRIAGAITYIGREITIKVKEIVTNLGYRVIYRDTDSCFIILKKADKEETDYLRTTIQDAINSYLHEKYKIKGNLRLDLEYIASKMLILAKKRYHGMKLDGESVIKGLNMIRKDVAVITVKEQEIVGNMRLNSVSIKNTKKYVDQRYKDVADGKEKLEDIMVLGRCNKKSYAKMNRNYKALLYSKSLGIDIPPGSRFWWLYIHPRDFLDVTSAGKQKRVAADVIAFLDVAQIPKNLVIDYKRMAEYTIGSPLSRYIDETSITQKTLTSFFPK